MTKNSNKIHKKSNKLIYCIFLCIFDKFSLGS